MFLYRQKKNTTFQREKDKYGTDPAHSWEEGTNLAKIVIILSIESTRR